jgi:hypothetical protein
MARPAVRARTVPRSVFSPGEDRVGNTAMIANVPISGFGVFGKNGVFFEFVIILKFLRTYKLEQESKARENTCERGCALVCIAYHQEDVDDDSTRGLLDGHQGAMSEPGMRPDDAPV